MINKTAKGTRREKELRDIFTDAGFKVDFKPRVTYQSPDLFKMFDFVCIQAGTVLWVQVKSNKNLYYAARKKIKNWLIANDLDISCEVWCKENRGRWFGSEVDKQGYCKTELPKMCKKRK